MTRVRTTRDCWRFYCDYGKGWEYEITEYAFAGMVANKKAYAENSLYPLRIVKGREKIPLPYYTITTENSSVNIHSMEEAMQYVVNLTQAPDTSRIKYTLKNTLKRKPGVAIGPLTGENFVKYTVVYNKPSLY